MNREDELQGVIDFLQKDIRELKDKNRQLKDVLKKHGVHTRDCFKIITLGCMNHVTPEKAECTCGLEEALKGR